MFDFIQHIKDTITPPLQGIKKVGSFMMDNPITNSLANLASTALTNFTNQKDFTQQAINAANLNPISPVATVNSGINQEVMPEVKSVTNKPVEALAGMGNQSDQQNKENQMRYNDQFVGQEGLDLQSNNQTDYMIIPVPERKPVKVKMYINGKPDGKEYHILPQYQRPLSQAEMSNPQQLIESDGTFYPPDKVEHTRLDATSQDIGRNNKAGKLLDWGDVAISNRSIKKGTQMYVPELNKVFTVEDYMNVGWDHPGYNKVDFAIRSDNKDKDRLQSMIGNKPIHFYLIQPKATQQRSSRFIGSFKSISKLPEIDGSKVTSGDSAYIEDTGELVYVQ